MGSHLIRDRVRVLVLVRFVFGSYLGSCPGCVRFVSGFVSGSYLVRVWFVSACPVCRFVSGFLSGSCLGSCLVRVRLWSIRV